MPNRGHIQDPRVGYGFDGTIQTGPMQSVGGMQKALKFIDLGIRENAKLILGGRNPEVLGDYPETCFLNSTLFEDVTP